MGRMPKGQFEGLSRRTFQFLGNLGRNNERRWFEANRSAYEQHVLQPMRALVNDLADFMLGIDEAILSPAFADQLIRDFGLAAPLYHYIPRMAARTVAAQKR